MKDKILEELNKFLDEKEKGGVSGSARASHSPATTDTNPAEAGRMDRFMFELKFKFAGLFFYSIWTIVVLVFVYIALKTSGRYDTVVSSLNKLFSWIGWVLEKG